ncbi:energy transducer TonB [Flammeovirgaceae bacterium SG7u.111]|nr:energy transducer TonB [Flammeovirgaceae bacterium SG7u.132]WPO38446.1 energy transducer TonB [Flammeovirgaceae bacterium SG7u.111]
MKALNKTIASIVTFVALFASAQLAFAQMATTEIRFSEAEGSVTKNVLNPIPTNYAEIANKIVYPRELRETQIEGKVIVEVTVNEKGQAAQYKVVHSPGQLLSSACLEHVDELTFEPALLAGKATSKVVYVPFRFRLTGE